MSSDLVPVFNLSPAHMPAGDFDSVQVTFHNEPAFYVRVEF